MITRKDILPIKRLPNSLILNHVYADVGKMVPLVITLDDKNKIVTECFFCKGVTGVLRWKVDTSSDQFKLFIDGERITTDSLIKRDHINHIDSGFFCQANEWGVLGQYFHFLWEILPKIVNYAENAMDICPLLITQQTLRPYVKEILNILGIPEEKIITIKKNQAYRINELYTSDWRAYKTELSQLPRELHYFNILRKKAFEKYPDTLGLNNIYISRKEVASPNNQHCSVSRMCVNEDEILNVLSENGLGFHRVRLGAVSIREKVLQMSSAENIIVAAGSSTMNILFSKEPKRVVILTDEFHHSHEIDYMKEQILHVNPDCQVFEIKGLNVGRSRGNPLISDKLVRPFWVDPYEVCRVLKKDK